MSYNNDHMSPSNNNNNHNNVTYYNNTTHDNFNKWKNDLICFDEFCHYIFCVMDA